MNVLRRSGIECLGDIGWGAHICQFYDTAGDLLDILVPFFREGLLSNEYCLWVLSAQLDKITVLSELRKQVPNLDSFLKTGQMEFVRYSDWYLRDGRFDDERTTDNTVAALKRARIRGYDGLRLTGDACWLDAANWEYFSAYEKKVNTTIGDSAIIALCTYPSDLCNTSRIIQVANNHHGSLLRRDGRWQLLENSAHKFSHDAKLTSQVKYHTLMQNSVDGVFLTDLNGVIFEANQMAEKLTGYSSNELISMHFSQLHPRETRDQVAAEFQNGRGEGAASYAELPLMKKNGETILVDLIGKFVDVDGKTIGQAIVRDVTERRRMQDRLKESESYYRSVFEYTGTATVIIDADGTILHANSKFEKFSGYARSEVEGRMKAFSFIHPHDRDRVRQYYFLRRMDPLAVPRNYEVQGVDRYGAIKDVLITIGMIPGTNKSIGSLLDITDRKRNEETLKTRARVFERMAEGVLMTDTSGLILHTNPAFDSMFGYGPGQLIGKHVYVLNDLMPEENERFVRSFSSKILTNGSCSVEIKNRKKDGTPFFTFARVSTIELSGRTYFISVQQDITTRKKERAALIESEKRFQQLADCIQEVFWMSDIEKKQLLYVSPAYHKIWGRTCQSFYENYGSFLETIVPEDRHIVADGFQKQRQGQGTDFEYRIARPDGSVRWIRSQSFPIFDEKGIHYRVAGISEDITDRKKAEETLWRYNKEIESLSLELMKTEDKERRRIATKLHDNIGQTLALAKINLGSIRERADSPSAVKSVDEVLALIEQSIQFTRSLTFELSLPILYELGLIEALEWLAEQYKEKHQLTVSIEYNDPLGYINDEVRLLLFKAVRELLLNVVKHAHASFVHVRIERQDDGIHISVEDNGAGFAPAVTYTLPGKGGGFGLLSLRERLRYACGCLSIESAPGRGTCVTIRMPLPRENTDQTSTREA